MNETHEGPDDESLAWWGSFFQSDCSLASTFRESVLRGAFEAYRKAYGKLPGSIRTSRLRKKRVNRIVNWYFEEFLPTQTPQTATGGVSKSDWMPEGEFSVENILKMVEAYSESNNSPSTNL